MFSCNGSSGSSDSGKGILSAAEWEGSLTASPGNNHNHPGFLVDVGNICGYKRTAGHESPGLTPSHPPSLA